jgi:hypothetical protein
VPYVDCDSSISRGLTALAALTFLAHGLCFPALCSWLLWHGGARGGWLGAAGAADFLVVPVRASWWRAVWVGPVGFGRRLLFAALVSGSSYASGDATLPMLVFCSLLALLMLQVRPFASTRSHLDLPWWMLARGPQVLLQPFASSHDNRLELTCLLTLLFGYFGSVLAGVAPSAAVDSSALAAKLAVTIYGVWCAAAGPLSAAFRQCFGRIGAEPAADSASAEGALSADPDDLTGRYNAMDDARAPNEGGRAADVPLLESLRGEIDTRHAWAADAPA